MRTLARAAAVSALVATLLSPGATQASPAAEGPPGPGALSYRLALEWNAVTHRLTGVERVTFTNTRKTPMTVVYLRLWPNSDEYGGSCAHRLMVVTHVVGGAARPLRVGCTVMPIELAEPLTTGASTTIGLSFVDAVPNLAQRFGFQGDFVNLATAFPIMAVTDDRATHLEAPPLNGEGQYSLSASFAVTLTIPAGLTAATTGVVTRGVTLADGRRRLTVVAAHARDFTAVIGRFAVHTTTVGGTRLRYFERPDARVPATTVLREWAAPAFAHMVRHYGAWYAPELDIVGETRSFVDGGMEYPQLIMTQLVESTVTHEVAHMWFYDMVGNSQYVEPWLDESVSEFASERIVGENRACNVAAPFGRLAYALDASMAQLDRLGSRYATLLYTAGPCVLEKLRRDWGDVRFDRMMRNYVATYRLRVATTARWKSTVRAFAPAAYDVDAFFRYAHLVTWPG